MQVTSRCCLFSKPTAASAVCCRRAFTQCRVTQTAIRIAICIRSQRQTANATDITTWPFQDTTCDTPPLKLRPRLWKTALPFVRAQMWSDRCQTMFGMESALVTKGTKTDYGVYCRGSTPTKQRLSSPLRHPDRICSPSSLMSNCYRGIFPQG